MNEHDAEIARLFAADDPPSSTEEFAAMVKQTIKRERRKAKLLAIASAAGLVAILTLAVFFIPFGSLYPIRVAQEFLTSFPAIFVCAGCALLLTAWLSLAET